VKANAYGHGLEEVAGVCSDAGACFFCVDSLREAQRLTKAGISLPVLIMGWVDPQEYDDLEPNYRLCIYQQHTIRDLQKNHRANWPLHVHLKLETGLNRQGLSLNELPAVLAELKKSSVLRLEGAYTHFANVEDTLDSRFFQQQLYRFRKFCRLLPPGLILHSCSSAAAFLHEQARGGLVRLGISLYGHYSSWRTMLSLRERGVLPELRPVLCWKAKIAQIKKVRKGDKVGYGCCHEFLRPGRIAVIPAGYYDGYRRDYSPGAYVLVNGCKAPVIGRIAMNMFMVEITHIPAVNPGDEVILIGRSGQNEISAEHLAEISGTINYEVLTNIAEHLPRVLV
jgi:alanine racemase